MSKQPNPQRIASELRILASQEGCDGPPYDQMINAARHIDHLEDELKDARDDLAFRRDLYRLQRTLMLKIMAERDAHCTRLSDDFESPPPYRKSCTPEKLWLVLDANGDSILWSDQEIPVDAAVEALNAMPQPKCTCDEWKAVATRLAEYVEPEHLSAVAQTPQNL